MLLAQASTHRKIPMDTHPSPRTYIPKKRLEFALNSTDFLCCDYSCVKIYFEIQRLLPDGMAILWSPWRFLPQLTQRKEEVARTPDQLRPEQEHHRPVGCCVPGTFWPHCWHRSDPGQSVADDWSTSRRTQSMRANFGTWCIYRPLSCRRLRAFDVPWPWIQDHSVHVLLPNIQEVPAGSYKFNECRFVYLSLSG